MFMKKKNVGLALGGGGVRGFAHIGVLEVLEENGLNASFIVGTSMGAIVGGGYALFKDIKFLKNRALQLAKRKELQDIEKSFDWNTISHKKNFHKPASFFKSLYLWNSQAFKKSLLQSEGIKSLIEEFFENKTFAETKIPYFSIATELETGQEVIFKEGPLVEAILSSCAIPGFFPPVEISGKTFVDGGVTSLVPVSAAKKIGAKKVIAVNVEKNLEPRKFKTGIDILMRMDEIRAHQITESNLLLADVVISPPIGDIQWYQFSRTEECIEAGRISAEQNLSLLKKIFGKKWHFFFKTGSTLDS